MDSRGGLLGGGLLTALFLLKAWDELKARRLLCTHGTGAPLRPSSGSSIFQRKLEGERKGGISTPSHWALPLRAYLWPLEDLPKASRPWDPQEEVRTSWWMLSGGPAGPCFSGPEGPEGPGQLCPAGGPAETAEAS